MKKIINKVINFIKTLNKKNYKWIKFIPKTLSKFDRILLLILIIVITVSGIIVWYRHYLNSTHEVPINGGILIEGIVGKPKDLDLQINRLTKAGLTKLAENGDVSPDIAESWQIIDDGKTYQFKIRQNYSAIELLNQIQENGIWSEIEISAPDEQTLVFKFKQPFSPFLYLSTTPLFDFGPYKIANESKTQINLIPDGNYWQGKANISKIQINLYSDYESLSSAAKSGEITSYLIKNENDYQMPNSEKYPFSLPRELNLFFNLSKPSLQNTDLRKNLRDGKPLTQPIDLVLVTSDAEENVKEAENIKNSWKESQANITIKTYDNVALQKEIIPNRDYDLLLYAQDYGPDPDPYPFWHSSQNKSSGSNLSNFSNVKADKLLVEARQTFDFNLRNQKYAEFKTILDQEVPVINIRKEAVYYIVSNKVQGVQKIYGSSEADRFLNIYRWYMKTKRVEN